jgi:FMN phosphatase YigB (HAD superfamily)
MYKHNKILFIDFDGVLCHDPFWHSLRNEDHKYHQYSEPIEKFLFDDNRDIFDDWMVGKYTSEDIHERISRAVGIQYDILFSIFKEDCQKMEISRQILTELGRLKDDYYLILATGNVDAFDRFILPSNPVIRDIFDEIHNSYNLKMLKSNNNGQYFINVVEEKKIPFSDCYLIDDSVSTCNIFATHGGKSFCVDEESEVLKCLKYL